MTRVRLLTVAALAAALTASSVHAQQQQPQTQRVSGTIERVDGNTIYGKRADGSAITLKLADNVAITAVLKATFADIKPGDYVGTGGIPQPDGSQKAVELRIFRRSLLRGVVRRTQRHHDERLRATGRYGGQHARRTRRSNHRGQVSARREAHHHPGERPSGAQCLRKQG